MLGKALQTLKNTKYIDIWSDLNYPCLYNEGVLFTQNNCFLLLGFFLYIFVFCFSSECLRWMCFEAKKFLSSVPLEKYLSYCDCLVSQKFWYFWTIFQSEFKFHSSKGLRNSAAKLSERKLKCSHFTGVARTNQTYAMEPFCENS